MRGGLGVTYRANGEDQEIIPNRQPNVLDGFKHAQRRRSGVVESDCIKMGYRHTQIDRHLLRRNDDRLLTIRIVAACLDPEREQKRSVSLLEQ